MRQQKLLDAPDVDRRRFENTLYEQGIDRIAGVDEAGRGCLAGPVVAAAVILPRDLTIEGLKDSKKLSEKQRERLFVKIEDEAIGVSTGIVDSREIDRTNILRASLEAMRIAVDGLSEKPDFLLIDGRDIIEHHIPQRALIKGDGVSTSIAAASIIAKVTRDHMMVDLEPLYHPFKFSVHKGYGTKLHMEEISANGPTAIHRMTFRGVK
jgi:ribonuclease HII